MKETDTHSLVMLGAYYNPASSRYPERGSSVWVSCDRCHTNHIPCCISWNEFDMCLTCVDRVTRTLNGKKTGAQLSTNMQQSQFTGTKMQQSQYTGTLMQQSQFSNTRMQQSQFLRTLEVQGHSSTNSSSVNSSPASSSKDN